MTRRKKGNPSTLIFVSNARRARVDRVVMMKLTGHKSLSRFTRYNTVDQADAKEAMQRLDDYFNHESADCCHSAASIKKGSGDFS
jgi:hypothetical protein